MIKLRRSPAPSALTDDVVKKLTDEYKQTGKAVWQAEFIAKTLLESSNNKCCFSECKLNEEGKYDEVEHFHPKSIYPDEVITWDNLLPINKACNIAKCDHDTKVEPIINPYVDDPKDHIYLKAYRFYGKTELGKLTIEVVDLNNRFTWVTPRFEVGEGVLETIEDVFNLARAYDQSIQKHARTRNRLVSRLKGLMLEGTEKYKYSAIVATMLLDTEKYHDVKNIFIRNELWTNSFTELEEQMRYCALDTKKP